MANGGITIQGLVSSPGHRRSAPSADSTPTPGRLPTNGKVLIQAYEDFGRPACLSFEQTYSSQIQDLVQSGSAVIEYFPVAILDRHFTDGNYSTRAANAAAAVANWSPDTFFAFHELMYQRHRQPPEGQAGLTDDRLISLVEAGEGDEPPADHEGDQGRPVRDLGPGAHRRVHQQDREPVEGLDPRQ